ncbi:Glycosyltransferase, GT2 family [Thiothrix caldifontis]|jgi:Predicted glycosyltransferases|uniref:Glycosyltransferase, GT2 family n=1 Tax=Thiothrix caldifontis TaxID=525918 RepID=A0A1H3VW88_9GAMM|nr:glycosyltransferase [Thiothrix caldifontis]SDZ78474.1 Glycosyltransferase, GT2 family [Thiothrix caldifontis]
MNKKTLHELYAAHTGKVSDKWSLYLMEYDRLFAPYRDQPLRMLEIGVQNGGSLEIWNQYFSQPIALLGCDINPDCAKLQYDDTHIHVVVGDANASDIHAQILRQSAQFDIVIDDGSHTSGDIIKSFALYFPHVVEGGVFVAEDLHCSYWEKFDGGIFYPYSSMSFFKRLADVINHEHWGVAKTRTDLVEGICAHYGCELDVDLLAQLHSVEFINSMCVVRKAPAASNMLGQRIIAGTQELVVEGHHPLHGCTYQLDSLAEVNNAWSNRAVPPEETIQRVEQELVKVTELLVAREDELKVREGELKAREIELAILYNSTAWKMTKPLRLLADELKHIRHVVMGEAQRVHRVIRRGGGVKNTLLKAIRLYRNQGFAGLKRGFTIAAISAQQISNDYGKWVLTFDTLDDLERQRIAERIAILPSCPLISVVMPCYNPKPEWLAEAIESVRSQSYAHWELCIADDASTDSRIREILNGYMTLDPRIKVVFRETNGHISAASNSALDIATGDYVALLDHDDVLAEQALYWIVDAITAHPDAKLLYSDEDHLNEKGERCLPFFKPVWSPHLACSQAYLGHLVCFKRLYGKPLFDEHLNGAQDYDLWLTLASQCRVEEIIHISKVLYHWRIHPQSTAGNANAKHYADEAGMQAVQKFVAQRYPDNAISVQHGEHMFTYALGFHLPESVVFSIIIPTKDKVELLSECVDSILNGSSWQNFEILILDNRSEMPETFLYFETIQKADSRVRVIPADFEFNWSKLNNYAANYANGDVMVFLNNDTKVISSQWLESLGGYAKLPDVGLVGALLLFEDGSIQHSGVVVGMGGWAEHVYRTYPAIHDGAQPFVSPILTRNVLAVTGACMAISKDKFQRLGGFDESFIICGSDVEICIRAYKSGLFNVMCAEARLFHYESKTRSSYVPAIDFQQSEIKYAPYRVDQVDPFYNSNLSLNTTQPQFTEDHNHA